MIELLDIAAKAGAGVLLGLVIFFMYRTDRRSSEKRLSNLLEKDQETREDNTKALTELNVLLRSLNGRK